MDSQLGSGHLNMSAKSPENHIGVKLPASIRGAGRGRGLHRAGLEVGHVGHQVEVVTAGHAAQLLEDLRRTNVDQSHRRPEVHRCVRPKPPTSVLLCLRGSRQGFQVSCSGSGTVSR